MHIHRSILVPPCAFALTLSLAVASPPVMGKTTANAAITNVKVQVVDLTPDDGIWPWVWVVNNVDWAPTASSTMVQIPSGFQQQVGWLGTSLAAALAASGASASASTGAGDFSGTGGGSASASAQAEGGAASWSVAQLFDGEFFAGAGTEVVVTADVQVLSANAQGGSAMALASLGISAVDGSAFDNTQAWIFDSPYFADASTPSTLTVRWDNFSDSTATGRLLVDVSAQAMSVPEPAPAAMLAVAVLLGLATRRRRAD
jgi:MYXO-CTERM domain-containing protein